MKKLCTERKCHFVSCLMHTLNIWSNHNINTNRREQFFQMFLQLQLICTCQLIFHFVRSWDILYVSVSRHVVSRLQATKDTFPRYSLSWWRDFDRIRSSNLLLMIIIVSQINIDTLNEYYYTSTHISQNIQCFEFWWIGDDSRVFAYA